ncbi:MAG: 16S rRNA (cytosine(1402)-N(4))-methyltransferase RsmH [Deltaproteobacteria bacterium]|nr:16S rRNA (cytosine(1402)-N(4))-methyltransferase RsmH [Deltaproteobacteria bacterium]
MTYRHVPVMAKEVIELLRPEAHKRYLDGTLGGGGHTAELLSRSGPDGQVLGLDWDEEALVAATERLRAFGGRLVARRANFIEAKNILREIGWDRVHGVLLDLGLSARHIESAERGFSFRSAGRLDMRMDRRQTLDAYRLVNTYAVADLHRILRDCGEEPAARRVALAIDAARRRKPIETTTELAALVARVVGKGSGGTHPATRTFQALRIAVNRELENLKGFLDDAYELLLPEGRMAVVSFHSLEDRLVKTAFRRWSKNCLCPPKAPLCRCGWSRKARLLTPRPLYPAREEIQANPRARPAKLRAVERV